MARAVTTEAAHKKWLEWLGVPDCTCPHEWRGLGRLYGISMGKSWVRMDTTPGCPHHEEARGYTAPASQPGGDA